MEILPRGNDATRAQNHNRNFVRRLPSDSPYLPLDWARQKQANAGRPEKVVDLQRVLVRCLFNIFLELLHITQDKVYLARRGQLL